MRTLAVVLVVGSFVALGATNAGAQSVATLGTGAPTTTSLLGPLDQLSGQSIAAVVGDPDAPYAPDVPSQVVTSGDQRDPEAFRSAKLEQTTSVTSGHLVSEVVIGAGLPGSDHPDFVRGTATTKLDMCPSSDGSVSGTLRISIASGNGVDAKEHVVSTTFKGTVDSSATLSPKTSVSTTGAKGAEAKVVERFANHLLHTAETAWRTGYCVKIDVSEGGSRTVKPKEKVQIGATAKPRFGGGEITGGMESKKTAGQKTVKPAKAAGSPAAFTYTAPDKTPGTGSVELKSTSKRGIGIEHLEYTTSGDYKIEKDAPGGYSMDGTKCDGLTGDWVFKGVLNTDGIQSETVYTVTIGKDGLVGTYQLSLNTGVEGAVATLHAAGAASLVPQGDHVLMKLDAANPNSNATGDGGEATVAVPLPAQSFTWKIDAASSCVHSK